MDDFLQKSQHFKYNTHSSDIAYGYLILTTP